VYKTLDNYFFQIMW